MKQCNKCEEGKDLDKFSKDKRNTTDGKCGICKECQKINYQDNKEWKKQQTKQYYENHKEYMNKVNKEGYENNKKHILKQKKEYRENHKKDRLEKGKQYANSPEKFNSTTKKRKEIEKYEQIRESVNGNVECLCTYCGDGFEPTRRQISRRLEAVDGKLEGEGRLYCSEKCKENCPIYKQHLGPKDQKPATSREVQPQLRQITFQRDEYICQKCGYHRDELEVGIHCHHIEGLRWNPIESADIDNCTTLCKECHNEVHDQPGCRYHELKCA